MTNWRVATAISLLLFAGSTASSALAMGPRASDGSNWPGMSQQANTGSYPSYAPDSAEKCGIYDNYCYRQGGLSLDNSGRNR